MRSRRPGFAVTFGVVLGLALAAGACASDPTATSPVVTVSVGDGSDVRFAAILSDIQTDMQLHGVPGASVAVVLDGKLAFAAGVGVRQAGKAAPVTAATVFRVASLGKMVIAATAMKLTEEGLLDLRKPVTHYVPLKLAKGFRPESIKVTDLLCHTSGLPDLDVKHSCPVGPGAFATYFAANANEPLYTPPGEIWNYSNRGYSVMGWVIERVTGARFEDAVGSLVFGPAGMTTATYDPTVAIAGGDYAVGHHPTATGNAFYPPNASDCEAARPPGGLIASVLDLAHFSEMLLADGGSTLAPTSVSTMETGHVDTHDYPGGDELYGYGLYDDDWYKGVHILRHDGDDTGYQSTLWIAPANNLAVVILYNSDATVPTTAVMQAIDELLGLGDVPLESYATPPGSWARFAGTYVDPYVFGTVVVTLEGEDLLVDIPSHGVKGARLAQAAGERFTVMIEGTVVQVTFVTEGETQRFVTRKGVASRQLPNAPVGP